MPIQERTPPPHRNNKYSLKDIIVRVAIIATLGVGGVYFWGRVDQLRRSGREARAETFLGIVDALALVKIASEEARRHPPSSDNPL